MKISLSKIVFSLLLLVPSLFHGQVTNTAIYTTGDISTEFNNVQQTSANSSCSGLLNVAVPVGRFVTGIDVSYDMEALGINFLSEQWSYLECSTTGVKETSISSGTGFNQGIQSYSRTNLTIANGIVPTGGLDFELHGFRTFQNNGCNSTNQRILSGTWTISVTHIAAPTCIPPTGLTVTATSSTSANLSWTTGGASNWQIEYGLAGFTPGTGTVLQVSTNPFTLGSLSPNTDYEVRVQDSCGLANVSAWTGLVSFKTGCSTLTAPWSEDFESADWIAGGFGALGTIDQCFSRNTNVSLAWVTGPPAFSAFNSGPSGDHTTGAGKYAYSEFISFVGPPPFTAQLKTPEIDVSVLNSPEMSFWYHMFGNSIGSLQIAVSANGGAYSTIKTITGQQQTSKAAAWVEDIVDLSAYSNDTIIVRFRSVQTVFGTAGDVAIDDISIYELPSCPKPNNVSFVSNTQNSITLDWTTGGATNWQIEYGPVGFIPGTGTLVATNTNPHTISGLSPSSSYDIYVRDSCGIGDVSFWVGPTTMPTGCGVVSAPYIENFDNSNWTKGVFNAIGTVDTCWDRTPIGTFFWKTGPSQFVGGTGATNDHTLGSALGKYIFTEQSGFSPGVQLAEITSPSIDLTALTVPELSFWHHMFGSTMGDLEVMVSNNGGSTFTSLLTISGQQQISNTDLWKESIINLAAYANDTVVLKFKVLQTFFGFNGNVCIDDVNIHEAPACPKPSNLNLDFAWLDNATLSWTSGGANNWDLEYGAVGFTPGSGTRVNVTSNPANITGLNASTSYDFYVRDSCGLNDVSIWVGPILVKTLCNPSTAPYTEDFSSASFSPGPNFVDLGTIDPCWRRDNEVSMVWKGGPPTFAPFNTGPSVDHTDGTSIGKYAFSESIGFGAATPREADLWSDLINISPLTNPQLSFWYHMFGQDIARMEVFVSDDGINWTQELVLSGQKQNSKADLWKEAIIPLGSYDDTIQIRFKAVGSINGIASDIAIDDILIDEAPACPKPQNLSVTTTSNNSITIDWQGGGAINWDIEYGPIGFAPGSGTILNVTSHPFSVGSLSANTGYSFYVRDSCGSGNSSIWVGPISDTTDCNPVAAPWTENFDSPTWVVPPFFGTGSINSCWGRELLSYVWAPGEFATPAFGTGPDVDHTSGTGKYLFSKFNFGIAQNLRTQTETQLIDLSPLTVPEFSFWYHMFGSEIDSLIVDISDGFSWSTELVLVGEQQTTSASLWKESIIDLSSYANDTIKIRMTAVRKVLNTQRVNIAIDDLDIHEQPTCPRPSNLVLSAATANGMTLSWTSGGASNWQIEYGAPGFVQGTGTTIAANTNPFTITTLNSSSAYDFYVRDSCGINDVSDWFGPETASTLCLPISAPFIENFDGSNYIPAVNFNDTGAIASCWNRSSGRFLWLPGPPPFPPFGTGPSGDHTTGSGQYMFTGIGNGLFTPPFDAKLVTPYIDLSPLTVPELSFWYHMFGTGIGTLSVEIDNGSGFTNLVTFTGQQQTSSADVWKESITNLSTYANDTVRFRFSGVIPNINFQSQHAIDDISIHEAPSCPKPQDLQSTGVTSTSVTLDWTTGGATNWQIEYGAAGFAVGTGTLVTTTSNPFTINGLSQNTKYDFYVRDSCGIADLSDWFGPHSDTTDCSLYTAPYTETFDNTDWVPSSGFDAGAISPCWDRNATTTYFWTSGQNATPSFNTGPSGDHTSGSGKYIYSEGFNVSTPNITSPSIDISALTNPELRFWYHMFGNNIDKLRVLVFDGSAWTSVATITGQQQTSETDAWQERIIDLSAYVGDTIKVRFRAFRNSFGTFADMAVDDVWIGNTPTCASPSNISVSAPTLNSLTLSWTTGGATNWQIRYRESGTFGPYTYIQTNTNPHVITGLNSSTNYDIYVQDSCGIGDVSFWVGPELGSTACGVVSAPWSESFDGQTWVPGTGLANTGNIIDQCWTRNTAITAQWGTGSGPTTSGTTGPSGAFSINNYIYREASVSGTGIADITSPDILIPANLNSPKLYFHYHMFGNNITNIQVRIDDGTGFALVYTKSGQQQTSSFAPWIKDSIDLASYVGKTIKFRFRGMNSGISGDIALDEISIDGSLAPCVEPSNLVVSNIAASSVDLTWTSANPGNSNVQYYDIAAGPPGTIINNLSSPYTLTGLNVNTNYVINVFDSCGGTVQSTAVSDTVLTISCIAPVSSFTHIRNILSVDFTSTSLNADSLIWNFDGTSISNATAPTFNYPGPGLYNVSLIAFNACGQTDTTIVPIQVCDSLIPNYTFVKNLDTVAFDASASQGAISYEWTFGNGEDSTGMMLDYLFPNSGNFVVTLKVKNACGDSASFVDTIGICLTPVAKWTYSIISSGGGGMKVQFDGSQSKNALNYSWDFGDGNTNTTSSQPIHTYVVPSLQYTVKLKVTNGCNETSTLTYRLDQIGIEEFRLDEKVDIYPNPAQDILKIEWEANKVDPSFYEVYDLTGKLLMKQDLDKSESENGLIQINAEQLANGIYLLRLRGSTIDIRQQFVIKH